MTVVTIDGTADGRILGYELNGHAMQAAYGKDIVCAALSVLAINTANSLEVLTQNEPVVDYDKESGHMKLCFDGEPGEDAQLLLSSFELGIRTIAETYGDRFVRLEYREV